MASWTSDDAACAGQSLTCAPKGEMDESRSEGALNNDDEAKNGAGRGIESLGDTFYRADVWKRLYKSHCYHLSQIDGLHLEAVGLGELLQLCYFRSLLHDWRVS